MLNIYYSHILLLLISCFIFGCSRKANVNELEDALIIAGPNRSELETVLNHYANDSLKYEAARFLIENMPGHYFYADTELHPFNPERIFLLNERGEHEWW